MLEFKPFRPIPRLSREIVITEKIDGTNACISITENNLIYAGSRTRWLTQNNDNYEFHKWVVENRDELLKLGQGTHYGEWWGKGINRGYGLTERRFSLFNVGRWKDKELPNCVSLVPVICSGGFNSYLIECALELLKVNGSKAAPGFMKPEGVVIYHKEADALFKKTLENDNKGKNTRHKQ